MPLNSGKKWVEPAGSTQDKFHFYTPTISKVYFQNSRGCTRENTCELVHTNLHGKILTWSLVKLRGIVNPWFLSAVMNIIIFWSTPIQIRYQKLNKVAWSIRHSRTPQRNSLSCPGSPFIHSELHLLQIILKL